MGFDKFYELLTRTPETASHGSSKGTGPAKPQAIVDHPKVATLPQPTLTSMPVEAPPPVSAAPKSRQPQVIEELTENLDHPVALEAWKDVMLTLERCIEAAISDHELSQEDPWRDSEELSHVLSRLSQRAMPVPIKQRLLAMAMLLYPRLRGKDRDRLVHALDHVPGLTRRDLQTDLSLCDHDVINVRSLVYAIERAGNLPKQLNALHRTMLRRLRLTVSKTSVAAAC